MVKHCLINLRFKINEKNIFKGKDHMNWTYHIMIEKQL
jgi:hypothetical protein